MTPAELEAEIAALRRDLVAARGLAEAAMSAAEAARSDLEALRAAVRDAANLSSGPASAVTSPPAPAPAPAGSAAPAAEPDRPLPFDLGALATPADPPASPSARAAPGSLDALAAPASDQPASPDVPASDRAPTKPAPLSLGSLAELVSDDQSAAPAIADLPLRPAGLLANAASAVRTTPIDLDRIDGVANDEEERRRARLAALEARLTRTDGDGARRNRLLELAQTRKVPDTGRGFGGLLLAALLAGVCVALDVWPLAFLPPVVLLCLHLWRREQNERLARLARGFAVPLHGRVLRDADEVLAWLNAFWPALVRPQDIWTSHRHVAIASDPDDFPVLLDVQLERGAVDGVDYRPRVDFYVATLWPARLPLLRPGSTEMSPAIAELYARLRRAGFTIRVESEAGLLLHGSDNVVERVRTDPDQLGTLHGIVRDAVTLARQLGATPAPTGASTQRSSN